MDEITDDYIRKYKRAYFKLIVKEELLQEYYARYMRNIVLDELIWQVYYNWTNYSHL